MTVIVNRICCVCFILTLFLPILYKNTDFRPPFILGGREIEIPKAVWSLRGWLDGSCQEQCTKYRARNFGMRSYLIKTYNQLQFTLFRRVSSNTGTSVIMGHDNWLYERAYVERYRIPSNDDGSRIEGKVNKLKILQDRLSDLGTEFVFVLAPSKAEIYPEYVPDKLLNKPLETGEETNYQQAAAEFRKHGIHFVDGHALFLKEKAEGDFQLFSPGGTHWNKYGAYLAWREINAIIGNRLQVPLPSLKPERIESRPVEPVEYDLGIILNLWDDSPASTVTDYPVFAKQQKPLKKPSILLVGDSFLYTLIDIIQRGGLATDVDAWYYFKRHLKYRIQDQDAPDLLTIVDSPLDKENIDWQGQMLDKDLVLLVVNEYVLPEFDMGFVDEALAAVKESPDDVHVHIH